MEYRLSIKRILGDGTILSVLLSILIYGALYIDPWMWVGDYPPDIQAAVGVVDVPLGRTIIVVVLCLGIITGVVLRSNAKLRRQNDGKLSFLTAFINSALIFLFFATWDLLILDWLIFVTIQPGFVVIPGTEGLAGYKDYWFHFQVSFLGWTQWISILVGGLVMAGLSMIPLGGRRKQGHIGVDKTVYGQLHTPVPQPQCHFGIAIEHCGRYWKAGRGPVGCHYFGEGHEAALHIGRSQTESGANLIRAPQRIGQTSRPEHELQTVQCFTFPLPALRS